MPTRIVDRRKRKSRDQRVNPGTRRRYPRVTVGFDGFYDSVERSLIGGGKDLNLRGVFLSTPVPDQPGTEAVLRLSLPGSLAMLKLEARVVHSNEDPFLGPVGMGLRFMEVLPWQIKRIAALTLMTAGVESFAGVEALTDAERSCQWRA